MNFAMYVVFKSVNTDDVLIRDRIVLKQWYFLRDVSASYGNEQNCLDRVNLIM